LAPIWVLIMTGQHGDMPYGGVWFVMIVHRAAPARTASMYAAVQDCTVEQMDALSVSEARAALPTILDRVAAGAEVTITRHGHPVAVIVRPDALRARRADAVMAAARGVQAALETGRRTARPATGLSVQRAEELVAEVRAAREGR
jgi:antitoxin (DNA-binding transcriptional repressor) of toxin-antitoxin stability system